MAQRPLRKTTITTKALNQLKSRVEELLMTVQHQTETIWLLAYKEVNHEAIITYNDATQITPEAYYEVRTDPNTSTMRITAHKG